MIKHYRFFTLKIATLLHYHLDFDVTILIINRTQSTKNMRKIQRKIIIFKTFKIYLNLVMKVLQ